jgi:hypothetical protein
MMQIVGLEALVRVKTLLFVGLGSLLIHDPAAAQSGGDRESLELAIVRQLRESLPKGRIALLRPRDVSETRTNGHTKALLDALGGKDVIDADEVSVMNCGDSDGGCHLNGVDGTISIRVNRVGDNEAEVDVVVQRAQQGSPRISYIGSTWSASRVGGVWKIGEAKSVRRS